MNRGPAIWDTVRDSGSDAQSWVFDEWKSVSNVDRGDPRSWWGGTWASACSLHDAWEGGEDNTKIACSWTRCVVASRSAG